MNNFVKDNLIFIGGMSVGFVLGGGFVIKKVLTTESGQKFVADQMTNKIMKFIFKDYKPETPRYQGKVSYRSYYTGRPDNKPTDIIFATKKEAIKVIEKMKEIAYKYKEVQLDDFYNLIGESSSFADTQLYWTQEDTEKMEVIRSGNAWSIFFPTLKKKKE